MQCTRCGSKELIEEQSLIVCAYCQSTFVPQAEDQPPTVTSINLGTDIEGLLAKCHSDPANSRRYASLILDIDPGNQEALGFMAGKGKR